MQTMSISPVARKNIYKALRTKANACSTAQEKWLLLQAAHIVGQPYLVLHIDNHTMMLGLAWQTRDWQEVIGQLFRLSLVPIGHAFKRLPSGNPGTSAVSAFTTMPIHPALKNLIAEAQRAETEAAKFAS